MRTRVDPNELLTLSDLANLLPGRPHATTLWRRAKRGVKAGDGTICFLKIARNGKTLLSTYAWWRAHVEEVGVRDNLQRTIDSADDHRRRRPCKDFDKAEAAAVEAGW